MSPAAGTQPDPASRRFGPYGPLVLGLACSQIVGWGITYHSLSAFIGPMRAELGLTATQINGAMTLAFVVCDVVSVPAGQWFDRHGGRGMATLGAALIGAMLLVWSQASDLVALYFVFALIGAGQGMALNNVGFAAVTANVRDARRGLNMLTLLAGLSPSIVMPLAGLMIAHWGWRAALIGLALVQFVGCALVLFTVLRGAAGSQSSESAEQRAALPSPLGAALRRPTVWLLVIAFSIQWFSTAGFTLHSLPILAEWGHPDAAGVLLMSIVGPAQIAGRLAIMAFWPNASGRNIGRAMWIVFALAMLLLATRGTEGWSWLVAFILLYGASSGVLVVARVMVIAEIFGLRGYGAVSAAIGAASIVARTGAPLLFALTHDLAGGYIPVVQGLAALSFIGAAAFYAATARERSPTPQPLASQ